MTKSKNGLTVLLVGLLLSASGMAQIIILPSCKSQAVSDCSQQCGNVGECIFGCEIGQFTSLDQCSFDCAGLGDTCVQACYKTIQSIGLCGLASNGSDGPFQIGYATNLTVGDSYVNLSNDGLNGGFLSNSGNICANVYVFDPQEEEIACCSCLTTPGGLWALSAQKDLISNTLTPSIPASIVIKLTASLPTSTGTCNPATAGTVFPFTATATAGGLTDGLLAWGTTLEPNTSAGTFKTVNVPFLQGSLNASLATTGGADELSSMVSVCNLIQADGSGYGICGACQFRRAPRRQEITTGHFPWSIESNLVHAICCFGRSVRRLPAGL